MESHKHVFVMSYPGVGYKKVLRLTASIVHVNFVLLLFTFYDILKNLMKKEINL